MIWLSRLDESLRVRLQTCLFWMGRKFGLTRRTVVLYSSVCMVLVPTFGAGHGAIASPLLTSLGVIVTFLVNLLFAAYARRGLRLVERNESWGTYTNWFQWSWLRKLELFLFPVYLIMDVSGMLIGEWWQACDLARSGFILVVYYTITLCEFPPKEKSTVRAPKGVAVGAH